MGIMILGHAQAWAIGVDRPQTLSTLGQPLDLNFPVRLGAGESIGPDCVHAEVLAGETRVPAPLVHLKIDGDSESQVRALRLQTTVQIGEPLVMVKLSVGCPVRFVRQYTAFVDPPGLQQLMAAAPAPTVVEPASRNYSPALRAALATSEARASALLAPQAVESAAVPVSPSPPAARPSAASRSAADGVNVAAPAVAATTSAKPAKATRTAANAGKESAPRTKSARARPAPAPGGRLQLEPIPLARQVEPAASGSAPAEPVLPEAAARRLTELERSLQQMQSQQRDTQAQLGALRAQLEREQASRFQNPVVYGLGLLSLALGLAAVYLARARHGERALRESTWWNEAREMQGQGPAASSAAAAAGPVVVPADAWRAEATADVHPAAVLPAGTLADPGSPLQPTAWGRQEEAPPAGPERADEPAVAQEPLSIELLGAQQIGAVAQPSTLPMPLAVTTAPAAARPALTVEDLIDLEQQVQFFLLLGQDDAAADLLERRLQSGMQGPVWPYLRLLEIHQRRGDQAAFAELAQRLRVDTGMSAPSFGEPLGRGEGLLGRSDLLAEIQAGWSDSGASMALLQRALTGRSSATSAGDSGDVTAALDLAAYHDLLMLYGVARDLSEHEVRGEQIDLFLPLDAKEAAGSAGMMATMPWQAAVASVYTPRTLSVDISLDEEPATPSTPASG